MTILDYGAGWKAYHARVFQSQNVNVVAYDFGRNFDPKLHCEHALSGLYEVVYASNVINVQFTPHALRRTFAQLALCTDPKGFCYYNYPRSPRLMNVGEQTMRDGVCFFFKYVFEVRPGIWRCAGPKHMEAKLVLEHEGDYTPEEIKAANIRPGGIVGRRAIVPRYVAEAHCQLHLFQ